MRRIGTCAALLVSVAMPLVACEPEPEPKTTGGGANPVARSPEQFIAASYDDLPAAEIEARKQFFATRLSVRGRIIAVTGEPISGARVSIGDQSTTTDSAGHYELTNVLRLNHGVSVTAEGYRSRWSGIALSLPLTVSEVEMPPIRLTKFDPTVVRFLFGGDTSFARRFLDPSERYLRDQMPADDPSAAILVSDPLPGSKAALTHMQPLFSRADYRVVNFESVITRDPSTPHREKDFAYFSLPESVPALKDLGIQYVSLGNNHIYDYLENGVTDTIRALDEAGFAHSGAGHTANEAFAPYRTAIAGHSYSFLSMSSVSGDQFSVPYYATEARGGAADLRDDAAVSAWIRREIDAQRFPIVQLHTGKEYSYSPSAFVRDRLELITALQPALVIGHHPHVAQGFGYLNGVLTVHSLGNFLFDQERLETMLGILAQIDLRGRELLQAEAIPTYIETFVPRLLVGEYADRFLRRLGDVSRDHGAVVLPHAGFAWVQPTQQKHEISERNLELDATVSGGVGVIDLRAIASAKESLAEVTLPTEITGHLGVDLLDGHGEFEDIDLDPEIFELTQWDVSAASTFPCVLNPHRGSGAVCSVRNSDNKSKSVVAFRNRVRVRGDVDHDPNKDVSLLLYLRGENAGAVDIKVSFHASAGEKTFGESIVLKKAAGSYDWTPLFTNLKMPADTVPQSFEENARALRVFLHHAPPKKNGALVSMDDVAIINWDIPVLGGGAREIKTPHTHDFIRVSGPDGTYKVQLKLRSTTLPTP